MTDVSTQLLANISSHTLTGISLKKTSFTYCRRKRQQHLADLQVERLHNILGLPSNFRPLFYIAPSNAQPSMTRALSHKLGNQITSKSTLFAPTAQEPHQISLLYLTLYLQHHSLLTVCLSSARSFHDTKFDSPPPAKFLVLLFFLNTRVLSYRPVPHIYLRLKAMSGNICFSFVPDLSG
jgi:hypothetical protein